MPHRRRLDLTPTLPPPQAPLQWRESLPVRREGACRTGRCSFHPPARRRVPGLLPTAGRGCPPGSRLPRAGRQAGSTQATPWANWPATSAAMAKASRVLPTPPGPVSVSRGTSSSSKRPRATARSDCRPTRRVRGMGNGWSSDGATAAMACPMLTIVRCDRRASWRTPEGMSSVVAWRAAGGMRVKGRDGTYGPSRGNHLRALWGPAHPYLARNRIRIAAPGLRHHKTASQARVMNRWSSSGIDEIAWSEVCQEPVARSP